jgi:putative flippase GtrA
MIAGVTGDGRSCVYHRNVRRKRYSLSAGKLPVRLIDASLAARYSAYVVPGGGCRRLKVGGSLLQFDSDVSKVLLRDLLATHGTRLVRFGLVGASGVMVNTFVLYILVSLAGMQHLAAAAFSSEVSILTNFALNDRWTFGDARAGSFTLRRCFRYNSVAIGGMVISVGILAILTMGVGMNYLIANLFAMGAAVASNYVLNTRFTWTLPSCSADRRTLRLAGRFYRPRVLTVPVGGSRVGLELE